MLRRLVCNFVVLISTISPVASAETFFCTSSHSTGVQFNEVSKKWEGVVFSSVDKFVIRTTQPTDKEHEIRPSSKPIVAPFVIYDVELEGIPDGSFKNGCGPYGWQELLICDENMTQTFFHRKSQTFERYRRFGFMLENEKMGDFSLRSPSAVTVGRCIKVN